MENKAIKNIMTRLSVRKFTGEPVKKDDLEQMLRAGMAAPSAVNRQPWSFVVVTGRKAMDELDASLPYAKMLGQAGAAIIVCGAPDRSRVFNAAFKVVAGVSLGDYWICDCSAATENILLAAHALGYGAVWTAVFPNEGSIKAVRRIIGIPDEYIPLNVIPIGVPAEGNEVPKDKYKEKNVHWERW